MQVLLPVDGSEFSDAAVAEVTGRPWPEGSRFRLVHVIPTPMISVAAYAPPPPALAMVAGSSEWPPALMETFKVFQERAAELLDKLSERMRSAGLEVDARTREGDPRDEILDEAKTWPADLIVMGSHGYSGIRRWLLGSVAQSVLSHAACSVEVVRTRQDKAA
jgi:nucleotide-binding universal stress UspA family protein